MAICATHQRVNWPMMLSKRLEIDFKPSAGVEQSATAAVDDPRIDLDRAGPGTGQFRLRNPRAAVFVGFSGKGDAIDLGPVR